MASENDVASSYRARGVQAVREAMSTDVRSFLVSYFFLQARLGRAEDDASRDGAVQLYGDAAFDTVLSGMAGSLGRLLGYDLLPTYSFARLYRQGHDLAPHRDRPACEHSLSVHLASSGSALWPLEFEDLTGVSGQVMLDEGEALAYRGIDVTHWRRPCPSDWHLQLFMHFVDANGIHADRALDDRPELGLPASERTRA